MKNPAKSGFEWQNLLAKSVQKWALAPRKRTNGTKASPPAQETTCMVKMA